VRAYPFDQLPKLTRDQARVQSALAGWLAARPARDKLAALVGGPVRITLGDATLPAKRTATETFDRFAGRCELRIAGAAIGVLGSSRAIRRLAQKLLGGPAELDAPRPLTLVEQSLWALVVATAVEDLGIKGEVMVVREGSGELLVALDVLLGDIPLAIELRGPALELRVPPARLPGWAARATLDVPVVVGRCALPAEAVGRLAVRDIITLDRPAGDAELVIFGGAVGLRATPNAVSAAASTGYVPRDMSLPDDAHVELTVALGTTQMSLRQVLDLAVGQIVQLGRPLAGPFELRAAGRLVGRGELVDVDGELGVRIVSIES
jgi:flagellar motor switch/type III secretory pathway protein FliN